MWMAVLDVLGLASRFIRSLGGVLIVELLGIRQSNVSLGSADGFADSNRRNRLMTRQALAEPKSFVVKPEGKLIGERQQNSCTLKKSGGPNRNSLQRTNDSTR